MATNKSNTVSNEVTLPLSKVGTMLESIHQWNLELAAKNGSWNENIVPYLRSEPGLGKTSIVEFTAFKVGALFTSVIVAQYDPAELAGFNYVNTETQSTIRFKPEFLPTDGNHMVLLDEFAQATMMQKNIMAQLIQERRLGRYELTPSSTIVLAGNRAIDAAGVNPDPSHVMDRVTLINVVTDYKDWITWANSAGIRPEITSYVHLRPDWFHKFDPKAPKSATPRGWTKVSTILNMNMPKEIEMAMIAGTVGPGAATDFLGFLNIYRALPDPDKVIADPVNAKIPDASKQADVMYALCGAIAYRANKKNINNIIKLGERMPAEFSAMMMTDALKRDGNLYDEQSVIAWLADKGFQILMP